MTIQEQKQKDISAELKIELFKKTLNDICPNFNIKSDSHKETINNIFRYCCGMDGIYELSKGMWIWGSIGTGKSTLLQVINRFNYLLNPKTHVFENNRWFYVSGGFKIINCTTASNRYSHDGMEGLEYFTYNNGNPHTIGFDELGREPNPSKYYGTEMNVMQYIFQSRYELRHECRTHVTTNMELKGITALYGTYIADRVKEMFNIVEVSGKSFR